MPSQPQSGQRFDFDFGPAFRMYMDNLESWRKTYEKLADASLPKPPQPPESIAPAYEEAIAEWQHNGEELFRRFIEQQMELCRFFANRWQQYLSLPEQFAHCRSPKDLSQVQLNFMGQMAADYVKESGKLIQPMAELMAKWMASRKHD